MPKTQFATVWPVRGASDCARSAASRRTSVAARRLLVDPDSVALRRDRRFARVALEGLVDVRGRAGVEQALVTADERCARLDRVALRVGLTEQAGRGLGVELRRRRDDDAARRQEERNQHARAEIEAHESAELLRPPSLQERVGEEEGHVDADGGRRRRDHHVALLGDDLLLPEGAARLGNLLEQWEEALRRAEDRPEVRDEPAEDGAPVDALVRRRHRVDDAEEAQDDQTDHQLEHELVEAYAEATAAVAPRDGRGHGRGSRPR